MLDARGASMDVEAQAIGIMHLDERDSVGVSGRPLHMSQRLMAEALDGSIWYGFVVVKAECESLEVGESALVEILFLDKQGARDAFPVNTAIRFGDGVRSRGTIELKSYL